MAVDTATMTDEEEMAAAQSDTEDQQDGDGSESRQLAGQASGRTVKFSGVRVGFTTTAAQIPANLGWAGWLSAWKTVGGVRESSKWWQGDLLNFAEGKGYGEKYTQLLDDANYGTLRNIASVAGKFTAEMRREGLEWSHHSACAALIPDHADAAAAILKAAEDEGWSVTEVKAAVREYREELQRTADAEPVNNAINGAAAISAEPRGVVPVDAATLSDDEGYECPLCDNLVFTEPVSHCLHCRAHFAVTESECPYCADEPTTPAAPLGMVDPSNGTAESDLDTGETGTDSIPVSGTFDAVSGQLITPADQSDVTVDDLYATVGIRSMPVDDAVLQFGTIPDSMSALMGLHEWLGRVIDAMAASGGKPKRGRPTKAAQRAAAASASTEPIAELSPDDAVGMEGEPSE